MFQGNMESREDNKKLVFKCFNQRPFRIAGPAYLSSPFFKTKPNYVYSILGDLGTVNRKTPSSERTKKGGAAVVNTGYIFSVFLTAWLIAYNGVAT